MALPDAAATDGAGGALLESSAQRVVGLIGAPRGRCASPGGLRRAAGARPSRRSWPSPSVRARRGVVLCGASARRTLQPSSIRSVRGAWPGISAGLGASGGAGARQTISMTRFVSTTAAPSSVSRGRSQGSPSCRTRRDQSRERGWRPSGSSTSGPGAWCRRSAGGVGARTSPSTAGPAHSSTRRRSAWACRSAMGPSKKNHRRRWKRPGASMTVLRPCLRAAVERATASS
jgi:hypothetical protein